MSQPLTGSRYEIHVARKGANESKTARDYFAIHPGDLEEVKEGDDVIGYVHSVEVGSTVDGPGIRFVGFLTGCLLRCQYCHNPDTWKLKDGTHIALERIVTRLGHFAPALRAMDGGFTISGGEPLVQIAFTQRIFGAAKSMGLHTALDTSGFLGARATDDRTLIVVKRA